MTDLWIDTRWEGRHGIGRYAREVCSRLTLPWKPLGLLGAPASPKGAVSAVPAGLIYSPGYNGFLRADQQVLTIHDLIHLQTPWPGRAKYLAYYNAVVKPTVKRAGVVITVSETSRNAIADWLNDQSVEIVNAGIGASPAFHLDVPPAVAEAPYLMYVGNLREHKNLRVVLEAMVNIPEARLRMLIPDHERDEAMARLASLGITEQVEIITNVTDEELASHYSGATATVLPAVIEGFGLPALESLKTGTPVIFWRGCDAIAETVGPRGLAVNGAHDVDEWTSAIQTTIGGAHPVNIRLPGFDWDDTAQRVEKTLRATLQN